MVDSVIILAAGQNTESDGHPNVLIRHPITGLTILDHALEAFRGKKVTVVVGHKALQIIEKYPKLNFVLNSQWGITKNSYSLGLALSDEPTYVVSGDIFFGKNLVERLDCSEDDLALTELRENRSLTSIHCIVSSNGVIASTYQGPLQDPSHPEAIGLYRISSPKALSLWKSKCLSHSNLHAGQLLPSEVGEIFSYSIRSDEEFSEVNNAQDYLNLVRLLNQND